MVDLSLEDKKILAHERHALAPTTPPGFQKHHFIMSEPSRCLFSIRVARDGGYGMNCYQRSSFFFSLLFLLELCWQLKIFLLIINISTLNLILLFLIFVLGYNVNFLFVLNFIFNFNL
jgi:hypothetical protein